MDTPTDVSMPRPKPTMREGGLRRHRRPRRLTAAGILWWLALVGSGCAASRPVPDLPVVSYVDLARYAGTWYEIASYPHRFQKGCVGTKATYSVRPDGKLDVLNQCRRGSFDAELDSAKGKAWVVDADTNARLKVSFFWPFSGDYWILDLGENYEYAVVSAPSREYLWVLSRTPQMDEALYERVLSRVAGLGFDLSRLRKTPQQRR